MSDEPDVQAGSDPVTKDQFKKFMEKQAALDAAQDERLVALEAQVATNTADIAALEGEVVPPDPPDPPVDGEPSPDGTEATAPGTMLVSAGLNTFELCAMTPLADNYGIVYNGTLDQATHHVSRLYAKGGQVFQEAQGHWYVSNDDGTWNPTSDPTKEDTVPIPPDPLEPLTGSGIMSVYTSSDDGSAWNFGTGTANDQKLAAALTSFNAELGTPVNGLLYFPIWGDQGWWGKNLAYAIQCANNYDVSRGLVPVVGIKLFINGQAPQNYGWNDVRGYTDVANGVHDQTWRDMVDACVDNGIDRAVFRIAYESNFSFMVDFETWSADTQLLWKKAFERVAWALKDQADKRGGITIYRCYNPSLGRGSGPTTTNLPDPNSYEFHGVDCYNGYYGDGTMSDDAERRRFWSEDFYGMNEHISVAASLGKPIFVAETGAGERPDGHGAHNSSNFWRWLSESVVQMRAAGVVYAGAGLWDVPAGDVNAWMSRGHQPPCMQAVNGYMADGTLRPDEDLSQQPTGVAVASTYNMEREKAWIEAHPEFVAFMRKRFEQIIERAKRAVEEFRENHPRPQREA
jgi:hypothetical protein